MQAASNYFNFNLLLNHSTEFGTLYSFVLLLMGVREHIYVWCPALTNGAPQMVEGNPYSVSIMYLYKDKQYTVFFFWPVHLMKGHRYLSSLFPAQNTLLSLYWCSSYVPGLQFGSCNCSFLPLFSEES